MSDMNFLTTAQAAQITGVHQDTVNRWIREGRLPAERVGLRGAGLWAISRTALAEFLDSQKEILAGIRAKSRKRRRAQAMDGIAVGRRHETRAGRPVAPAQPADVKRHPRTCARCGRAATLIGNVCWDCRR